MTDYKTVWKTVAQAAQYLKVTESFIMQEFRFGRLSLFRIKGSYTCTETSLDRWRLEYQ